MRLPSFHCQDNPGIAQNIEAEGLKAFDQQSPLRISLEAEKELTRLVLDMGYVFRSQHNSSALLPGKGLSDPPHAPHFPSSIHAPSAYFVLFIRLSELMQVVA